jgi:hypothetical protein
MPTERNLATDGSSMTELVTGIVHDAQELTRQQFAMFQAEIKHDLAKTKEAVLAMALGGGVALLGVILLCFMLVHLLYWAMPAVPLWAWFGIVGGVLVIVGSGLIYAGRRTFDTFNPLPDESAQAMRENIQWITTPK